MGHNGSTVLNLALNMSHQAVGASQLNDLLNPYDPTDKESSERTDIDEFWIEILGKLSEQEKQQLASANRGNAKEKSILKMFFSGGLRRDLAEVNSRVVLAIQEKTGARVLVDSSKNVTRAIALTACTDFDVYFLHLIRDVRGLVNSYNKRAIEQSKPKKYVLPTMHWFLKNVMASLLLRMKADKMLKVHYEEIVLQPNRFMDRVESFIGEPFPETRSALCGEIDIDQSTVGFSGNRVLKKKRNRFRTGQTPVDGVYQSTFYWYGLGWLSKFWGYRRNARSNQQQTAED